jgi:hypothetical protein
MSDLLRQQVGVPSLPSIASVGGTHAVRNVAAKAWILKMLPAAIVSAIVGSTAGAITASAISSNKPAVASAAAVAKDSPKPTVDAPKVSTIDAKNAADKPADPPKVVDKPKPAVVPQGQSCAERQSKCHYRCANVTNDCKSRCWFKYNSDSNNPDEQSCESSCTENQYGCDSGCDAQCS